jgi:hypothetical protein
LNRQTPEQRQKAKARAKAAAANRYRVETTPLNWDVLIARLKTMLDNHEKRRQ